MRILFVAPYLPSRIRTRSYNWIKFLSAYHRVTLLAPVFSTRDLLAADELEHYCERVVTVPVPKVSRLVSYLHALAIGDPLQAADCDTAAMRAAVARVAIGNFDVAHIEHLRGARLVFALPPQLPRVWDAVDSITLLFTQAAQFGPNLRSRCIARAELGRTRRFEFRISKLFQRVLVTSERDKAAFRPVIDESAPPISVLPNGVDLEYFRPVVTPRHSESILFSGKMSYHANVSAVLYLARQVMPLVWQRRPNARLVIVGADPPRSVRALATDSRVEVTGFVPDLRPYLAPATLAACPTVYSAGIQNKVLEAMSCGVPVVANPMSAAALAAQPDRDYLLAKTPYEMAMAITALIESPTRAQAIGASGRSYVERNHDWRQLTQRLSTEYAAARAEVLTRGEGAQ